MGEIKTSKNREMMKGIFVHFFDLAEHSGISKKIISQKNAFCEEGVDMKLCHISIDKDGIHRRVSEDTVIESFDKGLLGLYSKWINYSKLRRYILNEGFDFVYMRSFYNTNYSMLKMFRALKNRGVVILLELPTYPYKKETSGKLSKHRILFLINLFFRLFLKFYIDRIVTFTSRKKIHGVPTVNISNAIDFNAIPLKKIVLYSKNSPFNMIGVADIHYWHGFDRVIQGLAKYYENKDVMVDVVFHIVGSGTTDYMNYLFNLVNTLSISEKVIFHGERFGVELDDLFDISHFGIASLARHRTGITDIKTLKNREYAGRGIPFIYSEHDSDFDSMPYIMKAPADDSPIDIGSIIAFYQNNTLSPTEIRHSIESTLSWNNQIKIIIKEIDFIKNS